MDKEIIISPVITEKSSVLGLENKYVFKVVSAATKIEIRKAVETVFDVKVNAVNTLNVKPKKKRVGRYLGKTSSWKKAVVTLAEGSKINDFEKLV
jgi:large subunit ribosomal protein L23